MTNPHPSPMFLPKYPCVESMCSTCPFHPNGEGYAREHEDFPRILKSVEMGLPFFCHGTVLEHAQTLVSLDAVTGDHTPNPTIQPHFRSCLGAVKYKRGELDLKPVKKRRKKKTTAAKIWTVAKVREELQNITVKDGNAIHEAWVRGRKNKFASVCWGDKKQYKTEAAWETVVHCLNSNKPLIVS